MPGTGEEAVAAAEGAGARTVSLSPALPVCAVPKWEGSALLSRAAPRGRRQHPGGTAPPPGRTGQGWGRDGARGRMGQPRRAGQGCGNRYRSARDAMEPVRVGMLEQVPVPSGML